MFITTHYQLFPGIRQLQVKVTRKILLINGCKNQINSQLVRKISHTAHLRCCKKNTAYSQFKVNHVGLLKNIGCRHCITSHTRELVSMVTDTAVDENILGMKDVHKCDTASKGNDEEADTSHKKNDGKHKVHHTPVMVEEVLKALQPENGQVIVDMTFGAGGHAREIMRAAPDVHYIASDRDPFANSLALKFAEEERNQGQITPLLSRFSEVPIHLHQHGIQPGTVDAFFFDLGASSMQFDTADRGFSLSQDGPLDMRMDGDRFPDSPTAADVVNSLNPHDLAHILKKYGEERNAIKIANTVVEARYTFGKFTRTRQLADVIQKTFNSEVFRQDKLLHNAHIATKSFQALRIFVNNELNEINNGLEVARHYLKPQGRCVVISFHSLEDRIVKRHFLDIDINEECNKSIHDHFRNTSVIFNIQTVQEEFLTRSWQPLSRKVIEPSTEECLRNPRSRSAKLRAAVKL